MKRKLFLIVSLLGVIGVFSSCEREGELVIMLDNVIAPVLGDLPGLDLEISNSAQIVTFRFTQPVDPGFQASANYYLEVDAAGGDFADPAVIYSGGFASEINMLVSAVNVILLDKFEPDVTSSAIFRLKAVLNVDAGQGAPGSGSNPLYYLSEVKTQNVSPYGLPRLVLIGSGMEQMIQSSAGDGVYKGFVKMDPAHPFTLQNPDDGLIYGGQSGNLQVDGPAITPPTPGWHILTVNLNTNTYSFEEYQIGVVGSATANGWDPPDQKMDYDLQTRRWVKTLDLFSGHIKFRMNDDWGFNLGFVEGNPPSGPMPWIDVPLQRDGFGNDLEIAQDGNYTITLRIAADELSATTTIIKN